MSETSTIESLSTDALVPGAPRGEGGSFYLDDAFVRYKPMRAPRVETAPRRRRVAVPSEIRALAKAPDDPAPQPLSTAVAEFTDVAERVVEEPLSPAPAARQDRLLAAVLEALRLPMRADQVTALLRMASGSKDLDADAALAEAAEAGRITALGDGRWVRSERVARLPDGQAIVGTILRTTPVDPTDADGTAVVSFVSLEPPAPLAAFPAPVEPPQDRKTYHQPFHQGEAVGPACGSYEEALVHAIAHRLSGRGTFAETRRSWAGIHAWRLLKGIL